MLRATQLVNEEATRLVRHHWGCTTQHSGPRSSRGPVSRSAKRARATGCAATRTVPPCDDQRTDAPKEERAASISERSPSGPIPASCRPCPRCEVLELGAAGGHGRETFDEASRHLRAVRRHRCAPTTDDAGLTTQHTLKRSGCDLDVSTALDARHEKAIQHWVFTVLRSGPLHGTGGPDRPSFARGVEARVKGVAREASGERSVPLHE